VNDIEEVRIVTAEGVAHRAFKDAHGVLFTSEACNLEIGEAAAHRIIVERSMGEPFKYPTRFAGRTCERCL
jgi:hypothetical protein